MGRIDQTSVQDTLRPYRLECFIRELLEAIGDTRRSCVGASEILVEFLLSCDEIEGIVVDLACGSILLCLSILRIYLVISVFRQ